MELTNSFQVPVGIDEAWEILTDVERIAPSLPGARLTEVEGEEYRGSVKVKVGPITAEYRGIARFLEKDSSEHRPVLKAEVRESRGQGNASATITATLAAEGSMTSVSVVTDLSVTGKVAQFGRGVLADVSARLLGQFVANLEQTVLVPGREQANGSPHGPSGVRGAKEPGASTGGSGKADETSHPQTGHAESGHAESGRHDAGGSGAGRIDGRIDPGRPGVDRLDSGEDREDPSSRLRRRDAAPAEPVDLMDVAGASVMKRVVPIVMAGILAFVALRIFWRRGRAARS